MEIASAEKVAPKEEVSEKGMYDELLQCSRFLEPANKKKQKIALGPKSPQESNSASWVGKWILKQEKYQADQGPLNRFCIFFWSYMIESEPMIETDKFLSAWMSTILLFNKDWKKEDLGKDFEFYWKYLESRTTSSELLNDKNVDENQKLYLRRQILLHLVSRLQTIVTNAPKNNQSVQLYRWCCSDDDHFAHTENPIYRLPCVGNNDPITGRTFNSFFFDHKKMMSEACDCCSSKSSIVQVSVPAESSILLISNSLSTIEGQGKVLIPFGSILSFSSAKSQLCSFYTKKTKTPVQHDPLPARYANVANIGCKQSYQYEESSIKEMVLRVYKAHLIKPRDMDRLAEGDVPLFAEINRDDWLLIADGVELETTKNTAKPKLMKEIFNHVEKSCNMPSFGEVSRFMFMMKTYIVYSSFKFGNLAMSDKDTKSLSSKSSLSEYCYNFFVNAYKTLKPAVPPPAEEPNVEKPVQPEKPPVEKQNQPAEAPVPPAQGKQEVPVVQEQEKQVQSQEDLLDT